MLHGRRLAVKVKVLDICESALYVGPNVQRERALRWLEGSLMDRSFRNLIAGMASAVELWPSRTRLSFPEDAARRPTMPSIAESFRRDQEKVAGDMHRVLGRLNSGGSSQ